MKTVDRGGNALKLAMLATFVVFLFTLFGATAFAQTTQLESWDTIVTLGSDSTTWEITVDYKNTTEKDDIWVLGRVSIFDVTVDGNEVQCELRRDIGSVIFCNIPGKSYKYTLTTEGLANNLGNYFNFRNSFASTRITDRFTVTVKIPLGAALVESERLVGTGLKPFSPGFGQRGTDGRRILIKWDLENPQLGDTIPASIVYEQVIPITAEQLPILIIVGTIVIAGGVIYFFKRREVKTQPPTWKLNKEERNVLQIIATHGKIEQTELVHTLGINKVKVSRMVSRLKDLGFIKSTKIGRTHILSTTERAVEADWLVHLNEVKENVIKPWLEGLGEWHGEGEKPPLSLALSSKVKTQLYKDLRNHFPTLVKDWNKLWRDYTKYSRAWGRSRQALQAALNRHGRVISTQDASKMLRQIGERKPPADIKLSREIKNGARQLVSLESKLENRIERFREQLEKLQHYTKLPGSCEYME